ncbi:MAG: hypothetical protein AB7E27_01440 [Candidatus Methanomethylophilaceae archaeon]
MVKDGAGGVCDVAGCEEAAERSIATKKVTDSGLPLKDEGIKKVGLCKNHYREYKKATKKDRELDKLSW